MTVWDCFTFFNELDVLEWRLHEMSPVVDKFVLVEATRTFTYLPKPLYYQENKDRFAEFADKIVHIVVEDMPIAETVYFGREAFQRNAIMRGLGGAAPDDIIIVSDVDEIVRAARLSAAISMLGPHRPAIKLGQGLYYYFVNLKCTTYPVWYGPRIARFDQLGYGKRWLPQNLRIMTNDAPALEDAGWHFSFLGGLEAAKQKLAAWSHYEWNRPPFNSLENLIEAMIRGRDWDTDRDMKMRFVPVDESYPAYFLENRPRFAHHIANNLLTAAEREQVALEELQQTGYTPDRKIPWVVTEQAGVIPKMPPEHQNVCGFS